MKLIDRIVVRSGVANWPLPSLWPTAIGIGSAVMAVPVATVTDRSDLGGWLLVPILLAVVYQGLMVVRRLWCDRHPYLSQRWLDGARNVLGNELIDGALIRLRDAAPRGQDRVVGRIEMIEAVRAEHGAREDARKAAAGVPLSDAGGRLNGSSSASPIA
ncbi:hypothetical protein [Sphingomonas sp. Leaf37]|uniref:hypothetical protein n=1 Tax=Sphingomonas sp. Leaf37 TaxID=2876552 RepID=UPI001E37C575|nr:hypothetical protein [Sphingomonas sp. Leaf37]